MIDIRDGLGRPLHTEDRGRVVPGSEKNYPNCSLGVVPWVVWLLLMVLVGVCLASCGTTKTVYKETVRTDSTALHELELAKRTIETQEQLYQQLKADSQGVLIQYADADTIYVNKVSIDRSGAIQAEGRLRSVSIKNSSLLTALSRSQRTIDSFSHLQRRDSIVYRTQTKIVYREVKRRNWWWLWFLAGFVAGWAARHNWPRVRTWAGTIKSLR